MGPRCSSAETQICHRSYIIAARHDPMLLPKFPFILSNFNFCPLAWHFCTEKNSKKIEKVQERALRFVYEDYNSSYDNLLTKAKVERLWNFPLFRISYIALVPLSASALIACTKSGSLRFSQFSGC